MQVSDKAPWREGAGGQREANRAVAQVPTCGQERRWSGVCDVTSAASGPGNREQDGQVGGRDRLAVKKEGRDGWDNKS